MKPMIYDTFNWLVRDLPLVQLSSVNPEVQIHNPSVCRHVSFLSIFCLYTLFKMTDKCFFIHLTLITMCPYKTIMTPTWTSPTHVVGWLIVHTLIASKVATIPSKISWRAHYAKNDTSDLVLRRITIVGFQQRFATMPGQFWNYLTSSLKYVSVLPL